MGQLYAYLEPNISVFGTSYTFSGLGTYYMHRDLQYDVFVGATCLLVVDF